MNEYTVARTEQETKYIHKQDHLEAENGGFGDDTQRFLQHHDDTSRFHRLPEASRNFLQPEANIIT
jgi:hypothetical protein